MPKVKYNEGVRFIQNVHLGRGAVTISDLTNARGQSFNIPYGVKVDLLSGEYGFNEEMVEQSLDLYTAIDGDMVEVINQSQYDNTEWNSEMLQPIPEWELQAEVKDLRRRGQEYKAPPNEYDLKLYEHKREEEEANRIELERQQGMAQVEELEDIIEYSKQRDAKEAEKKGKAGFTNY